MTDTDLDATPQTPGRVASTVLVVLGVIFSALGGVVLATLAGFLVPLRAGVIQIPVSVFIAGAGNYLLVRWTFYVTRVWLTTLVPSLTWFTVVLVLGARRGEGDLVIAGNDWVGITTMFVGAASLMVGIFLTARRDAPPARRPATRPETPARQVSASLTTAPATDTSAPKRAVRRRIRPAPPH